MGDLEGLKRVLRSLVVSTPTTVDAVTLLRDYRRMVGAPLPVASYGYRDPVQFLREQCADSFLFQGPQSNPVLTLIVNKSIKHIDQYVQSQKMPKQLKGKRRSVPDSIIKYTQPTIAKPFIPSPKLDPNKFSFSNNSSPANSSPLRSRTQPTYPAPGKPDPAPWRPVTKAESPRPVTKAESPTPVRKTVSPQPVTTAVRSGSVEQLSVKMESLSNGRREPAGTSTPAGAHTRLQQYLEAYRSQQVMHGSVDCLRHTDTDSGTQTLSSSSGRSAAALARLQDEVARLVARQPQPVSCGQLLRLYKEEYGRELDYSRFGFASVSACACAVEALAAQRAPGGGEWLLWARAAPAPAPAPPVLRVRRPHHAPRPGRAPPDPDDALPGIDYDPEVFPEDCLSFLESIPPSSVADVAPHDMLPVVVGEVYSPSHLWLLRLGPDYDTMEEYMDQMTEYYTSGEGKDRVLAAGARRPGQYCSSVFEGDWHRSLIVQVVDADTVKVRHVDYGTVDTVAARALRPLRRQWAALPARALRARLAGLRPAAASRRWPRAAAAHCLELVRERRLVANVVAVDREEDILEVLLIDTSTDEDVNITERLIRAGHADPRPESALGTRESYLYPLFGVLEAGETPNFAEIYALLRDGIALEFVDAYTRHVPALLPSDDSSPRDDTLDDDDSRRDADTSELGSSPSPSPSPPPPPPPAARNRVPLTMLLPAREAPAPPAWVSTTSVATSTSPPPATPPPPPAVPKVFTFSARPAPPATEEPPSVASTLALAASRAPSGTSLAPPAAARAAAPGPPHPHERAVYARAPAGAMCARAAHPAAVYALPPCACAGACCAGARFPYAAYRPEPPRRPPPVFFYPRPPVYAQYPRPLAPAAGGDGASVRLSAAECEVFEKLSRVDPGTAHRYMMEALRRARAHGPAPEPDAAGPRTRPPPGFERGPV